MITYRKKNLLLKIKGMLDSTVHERLEEIQESVQEHNGLDNAVEEIIEIVSNNH